MYDSNCEDLARRFLGDRASDESIRELAQMFQDCAEDFQAEQTVPQPEPSGD